VPGDEDADTVDMPDCIRCGESEASTPLGYCEPCALDTRVEFVEGFRRLRRYLLAWARFDEWLRAHGAAS